MRHSIELSALGTDLIAFGERNHLRPTRLEVLGPTKDVGSDFGLKMACFCLESIRIWMVSVDHISRSCCSPRLKSI